MSNKTRGQLLVTVFGVVYWIVLPAALYLLGGSQAIIAFAAVNLAAIGGTVLVVGRP